MLQDRVRRVTAVEPSAGFRASLHAKYDTDVQGDADVSAGAGAGGDMSVQVRDGTGQRIPLPDNSVDAVFIAQAFHWMAEADTLDEIHRVLKVIIETACCGPSFPK
jgi:hypothetical protein